MSLPCLGPRKDDLLFKLAVHKVLSVEFGAAFGYLNKVSFWRMVMCYRCVCNIV